MFGRDAERERIGQVLESVQAGAVGIALEGAPGIGKTTLWRDAVSLAGERGYRVIATAPSEPDSALPFACLGDLLDGLPAEILDGLPEPQRRALRAALFLSDGEEAPSDPQATSRAVLATLRELCADAPVVVAIDDEQWLDPASARVLAFVLHRVREERIALVLARRTGSAGALWRELRRGFGSGEVMLLALEPLSMSALNSLLGEHLSHPARRHLLRRIYEASGGNPLYALEIARGLGDGSDVVEQLPIPATLQEAIAQRLERLDSRAVQPLLVVAALRQPTLTRVREAVTGFEASDLEGAERADVIDVAGDRVRFTHPLLASVHYAHAPAAARRALHRRLAQLVDDAEERANHLALGAEGPDSGIAAMVESAAHHAIARGAPESAAELFEHARDLTPAEEEQTRWSRALAAAEQFHAVGDFDRARSELAALLDELPAGSTRGHALLLLARTRIDDLPAAVLLCERALAEASGDDRLRASIEALSADLSANLGDQAASARHATRAVEAAERVGDLGQLAVALAVQGMMAFFRGEGIQHDVMTRAIALEPHAHGLSTYELPSTSLGCQFLWSDDIERARPLLELGLRRATDEGHEEDRLGILFHLAHLEWTSGDLEKARRYTAELEDAIPQSADDQEHAYVLWLRAFVEARHGVLDEASALATEAVAVAQRIGDTFIVIAATTILASTDLWSGRPGASLERLEPILARAHSGGACWAGFFMLDMWACEIEALIAAGRLEDADRAIAALNRRAREIGNPHAVAVASRARGLLLATRGDMPGAIAAMEEALTEHAQRPVPLEHARTLLALGITQRRAKRRSAARATLDDALVRFTDLGAHRWAQQTRREIGRLGGRRARDTDELTPTEHRIAAEAATGRSNREIAATLFVSERTVEANLTRAYRKLGVRSRTQLARRLPTV